jgi:hypothetical protein
MSIVLPENAPAGEILEALLEYMGSEELAEEFGEFVERATWSDEELALMDEDDEADDWDDDRGYCVAVQTADMDIGATNVRGFVISVWSDTEGEPSGSLPAHLDSDRHTRFLSIEKDLFTEILLIPKRTLH